MEFRPRVVTLFAAGRLFEMPADTLDRYALIVAYCEQHRWPIIDTRWTLDLSWSESWDRLQAIDFKNPGRVVSALCVDHKTEYRNIADVRYYDDFQDANRFDAATPIVGHPPCRAWSRSFSHQAKPLPGEKELGLKCAEWLKQCGGVLEHPAHSHLFEAAGLPRAGERRGELVTVEVLQSWWGFSLKKRTWLCFSHIDIDALEWPFTLRTPTDNAKRFREMTTKQRSHTVPALAHWLINAARTCTVESHAFVPQLGLDPRPPIRPQQPMYTLTCAICGNEFETHREHADTCSPKCRKRKSRASSAAKMLQRHHG